MQITELNIYPIKSCHGMSLQSATVLATGLAHDRRWMLVNEQGRFLTQREDGRLALIRPILSDLAAASPLLSVTAPGMPTLEVAPGAALASRAVRVWDDAIDALDEGDAVAEWFTRFLDTPVRLVRFDDRIQRLSQSQWTGDVAAPNRFSDGFPILLIGEASLADLNTRLPAPLPMNRFRPNIVVSGLPAYGEDQLVDFGSAPLHLRAVKPCTRCKITTTDQATGTVASTEPLATLMQYRRNRALRGVVFGQNVIVVAGAGAELQVGQKLSQALN